MLIRASTLSGLCERSVELDEMAFVIERAA